MEAKDIQSANKKDNYKVPNEIEFDSSFKKRLKLTGCLFSSSIASGSGLLMQNEKEQKAAFFKK